MAQHRSARALALARASHPALRPRRSATRWASSPSSGSSQSPHRSAGRVPTDAGLRVFVDRLAPRGLDDFERRDLAGHRRRDRSGGADAQRLEAALRAHAAARLPDDSAREHAGAAPRPRWCACRARRILAVLVAETGAALRRVLDDARERRPASSWTGSPGASERTARRDARSPRCATRWPARSRRCARTPRDCSSARCGSAGAALRETPGADDPGDPRDRHAPRVGSISRSSTIPSASASSSGALETKESLLHILRRAHRGAERDRRLWRGDRRRPSCAGSRWSRRRTDPPMRRSAWSA
jgi:hypothetical protein